MVVIIVWLLRSGSGEGVRPLDSSLFPSWLLICLRSETPSLIESSPAIVVSLKINSSLKINPSLLEGRNASRVVLVPWLSVPVGGIVSVERTGLLPSKPAVVKGIPGASIAVVGVVHVIRWHH